ncbi:hypothetical protein [Sphingomonas sp. ID0503]|uniref:hypothetical protein n=1 Tax=Sphingomonas sp. ID0503 TaxID=3399691 RepID=UPI003AFA6B18
MPDPDITYFERRRGGERLAAADAQGEARLIHLELVGRYDYLLSDAGQALRAAAGA